MNARRSKEAMLAIVEDHMARRKSPMGLWLSGCVLSVSYDSLSMEFLTRREMTDAAGQMHGGVISTLIEEVIELMVNCSQDDLIWRCFELNVKFVRPIDLGQQVSVEATIDAEGPTEILARANVFDHAQQLVATGSMQLEKT